MSLPPYLEPDMVELIYQKLIADPTLAADTDLSINKWIQPVSPPTVTDDNTVNANKQIYVHQSRCGVWSWNSGGLAAQHQEYLSITTIVRVPRDTTGDTAYTLCNNLRKKIKEIMYSATFPGTGWLTHKPVLDSFPSVPITSHAHHVLTYEVWTSVSGPPDP
jgi:hypothetical protein